MKIKSTYQKAPKPLLIAFVLLMVVTGVYFVYQSFAAEPLPTASDEAIIEYVHGHSEVAKADLLSEPETLPFRLYGTGLAICGDYPESDSTHSAQYYSKQLSKSELNKFIAKFNQAKFASLDQMYASSPKNAVANKSKTITFNTSNSSTRVTVFEDDGSIPSGFSKAESAINQLCNSLTQPYVSDNVEIRTKKVDPKLTASSASSAIPTEVEAPIKDESVHVQSSDNSQSAKTVASNITQKKGTKFYQTANGVVQVVASQQLPQVKEKLPTNKQSKQTASILGISKANANSIGRVRFALFCSSNSCIGRDVNSYMNSVRDWYRNQEGKVFDVENIGIIYGSQPTSYYQSADSTTFNKIFDEMSARGMFQSGSPLELILGFSAGPRGWCGYGSMPGTNDFTQKYNLAISDFSSPGGNGTCSGATTVGNGFDYRVVAHELGHNFTLWHTTGSGQAGGIMGYDYMCDWPVCSLNYSQALYVQNNPLFYAAGPVAVAGQVTVGSKPIGGAQIDTCTSQTPTTFNSGYFLVGIQSGAGFCIRHKNAFSAVSGYAVSNNTENKTAKTYEYQIAGVNCYHVCSGPQGKWDLANDAIYHFHYAEARALAVKPGSTQGQKLDSWGKLFGWGGASAAGGILFRNWDIARSVALNSSGQGYVLDGFGGLHPFGGMSKATGAVYWSGWDIARDVKFVPGTNKGYVLDGLGPLHAFNGASTTIKGQTLLSADLAKKFVIINDGTGGYVLDGWGGIHAFGLAGNAIPAAASKGPYWSGWDIARSIVINPEGTKGYVLDGFGGITPFRTGSAGLPPKITNGPYWPGWDIAKDIVITNWNTTQPTGYVLDGYGGIHKFGGN